MSKTAQDRAFDRAVAAIADTSYSIACEHAVRMGASGMTPGQVVESIGMGHWDNPTWDDAVYALAHAHRSKCVPKLKAAPMAKAPSPKVAPKKQNKPALPKHAFSGPKVTKRETAQIPKTGKTMRRCLGHGGLFESDGPHNRVCDRCKSTSDWKSSDMGGIYA